MGRLQELMDQVFEADGTVKACGRDVCKALILECNMFYPDTDFGSSDTGTMNVEAILNLKNRIVAN